MSDDLDDVRREVASAHGLSYAAVPFVTGTTLDEIESSAVTLAALTGSHASTEQEQTAPPSGDLFARARAAQQERKQKLVDALVGRREQPRRADGKWASFDGGARAPVPAPTDPAREHDELIVGLANASRVYRGAADAGARF